MITTCIFSYVYANFIAKKNNNLYGFVGDVLYGDRLDDVLTKGHFSIVQGGFTIV